MVFRRQTELGGCDLIEPVQRHECDQTHSRAFVSKTKVCRTAPTKQDRKWSVIVWAIPVLSGQEKFFGHS